MSQERFDPYYVWMGIPPDQQPPSHYRLLGLEPLEANGDVIANAGEQRMAHLRSVQIGRYAQESQRLLSEISAAMRVLLDPARKAAYDAELRQQVAARDSTSASGVRRATAAGPLPMSAASRPAPRTQANAAQLALESVPQTEGVGARALPVILVVGGLAAAFGLILVASVIGLVWHWSSGPASFVANDSERPSQTNASVLPPLVPPKAAEMQGGTNESESPAESTIPQPVANESTPASNEEPRSSESEPQAPEPVDELESAPPVAVSDPQPVVHSPPATALVESNPEERSESQRLKPPSPAEQKQLLDRLAGVYPPEKMKGAKQTLATANEFIELASDSGTSAVERFVLLRRAAELAVAANDAELLSRAVKQMAATFDINAIDVEGAMLIRMAASASVSNSTAFARNAVIFADLAAADQRYDMARRVLVSVTSLPPTVLGETARTSAQRQLEALGERESKFIAVGAAEDAVAANPTDIAAHSLLAHWYCFQQQDWPRGLAHMTRGGDATLRNLATLELAGTATPSARLSIASGWWDAAQTAPADDKRHFEARAFHWYQLVDASAVTGLDRALLAKRLADLGAKFSPDEEATSTDAENVEHFDALFAKAMDAVRENRFGDADRLFAHCVRLRPDDAASANNYALTGIRVGQSQRAVKQWSRMLAAGDGPRTTLQNLERLRLVIERDKLPIDRTSFSALEDLIKMASANAMYAQYRSSKGWQYEQTGGEAYNDKACMYCNGLGTVDCPVRGCSRGKVRVAQDRVVGRNTITGQPITQSSSVSVTCNKCDGAGTVDCQHCSDGIERQLRY